jgi:hypothetical protein
MSQIDWSKAPEWADIHGYVSDIAIPVWVGNDQYCYVDGRQCGRVFSFYGCEGWSREQIKGITTRSVDALKAESAPAWVGVGLPPVGTVCLMLQHKCAPVEVQIRYQDANICVWVETSIAREFCSPDAHKLEFRPIRTPEQIIADREREERIKSAQVWLEGISQEYGQDAADKCEDILMEFEKRKQESDK